MVFSESLSGFLDQLGNDALDMISDYIRELKEKKRKAFLNKKNPDQYELFTNEPS